VEGGGGIGGGRHGGGGVKGVGVGGGGGWEMGSESDRLGWLRGKLSWGGERGEWGGGVLSVLFGGNGSRTPKVASAARGVGSVSSVRAGLTARRQKEVQSREMGGFSVVLSS